MKHYCENVEAVLAETDSRLTGLTAAEAEHRLTAHGRNKLATAKKDSLLKRILLQMVDPMILILLAAAIVSAAIAVMEGGEGIADVVIILTVVFVNAFLGVFQESKAEKAIEALQEMAAATSRVLRDGQIAIVKSEELVPGDIVLLEAGDAIPADGRIIESASLKIEEAALTGESVPVTKHVDALTAPESGDIPLGDRKNMVYMGSTVAYGRGVAVITATGMDTEMGKIAGALAIAREGKTPLQLQLTQLSKILTVLVLGVCAIIFAVGLIRSEPILDSFLIAVSLAVAAIPEGLVAVVTVVLSIGVSNMSRQSAIIRKLTAVETLGCAQIICSDKTGTLTRNKMTVTESYTRNENLLATGLALCSDAELGTDGAITGEPTENALVAWALTLSLRKDELKVQLPRIGEAPFDSGRKMMSTVHQSEDGAILQFTKGAPDEVLRRCTEYYEDGKFLPMTDAVRSQILAANKGMADCALRVLAGAMRKHAAPPAEYEPADLEQNLCFLGLVGMIDPVRPEVKDAIAKCRTAGIRPIMITGDHVDTASAIARELGILSDGAEAVTGAELSALSDEEFSARLRDIAVYARVQPEHKTRIVAAWQNAGHVTAMTGDGVNDAPSIKTADIGVGMGITGTDVTKNVADMVLADDNFATIVSAVEEGRRIYGNIRKVIQFLLSSNLSEVISIFVATLLGFTILKPVHLLWINLVTDSFPALALGMEPAEPDVMLRSPRNPKDGVFAGRMGFAIGYQGLMVALLTLAAYFIGHYMESGVWEIANSPDGMTMAFLTMNMAEVFHSLNLRSQTQSLFRLPAQNWALNIGAAASFVLTTLIIYVPFLANAFSFSHIRFSEYLVAMVLAIAVIPIVELVKFFQRRANR